jgi:hypothetical protein
MRSSFDPTRIPTFSFEKKFFEDDQKKVNFCDRTRTWTIVFLST